MLLTVFDGFTKWLEPKVAARDDGRNVITKVSMTMLQLYTLPTTTHNLQWAHSSVLVVHARGTFGFGNVWKETATT